MVTAVETKIEAERPKSFLERSRVGSFVGSFGSAVAKGAQGGRAGGDESEVSTCLEDEEAFVRSIEQSLKECDVMWDDY
eukprot:Skav221561  [mRNA]  locus=scaffold1376:269599:273730:+ [translate_table: standard]